MKSFSYISGLCFILLLGIGLSGCGGELTKRTDVLTFPTYATRAAPTLENGQRVARVVAVNQIGGVPGLNSIDGKSGFNIALLSRKVAAKIVKQFKTIGTQSDSLNKTLNESENCSDGGRLSYSGSGDKTNGVSVTYTADNCSDGVLVTNGSVLVVASNYDSSTGSFKNYRLQFTTDYSVSNLADDLFVKILQNSTMGIDVTAFDDFGDMKDYKVSETLQATNGSDTYGLEDALFVYYQGDSSLQMYQTKGRVYINNLTAYVDYDRGYDMSLNPFVFSGDGYRLQSGAAVYRMQNDAKLEVIIEDSSIKVYIDADGDGTFEIHN